jgi:hypothetical protein
MQGYAECPRCGSVEFCIEIDENECESVVCRNCDKTYATFGGVDKKAERNPT